ncbi:MAG: hypothetical protein BEU01_01065 [Marine Group III euryarchaeote CG-Epi4]|uniref:fructokinase n=1 Tax=Marine Group III euryarchaeote CG-Epi4 TaxID=1888998 RepID=A0A1J5TID8_9ARCH|nr:MAG: hypothetical protein BEU01_01065 [Marine Group III euryarchaeote CG-Epi4]
MLIMFGGIELGGTKCILAVAESPRNIISKKIISTGYPENTFSEIYSFFSDYSITRLGVGSFGPIILNPESEKFGTIVSESKDFWEGVNVFHSLEKICTTISIDTDVNAAAIGEYKYGLGAKCQTLAYVTVGTGIGVGVLLDGKPFRGNFHLEAGHMKIPNKENYTGVCKLHGDCWEGLASGPSMKARWGVDPVELPENHEAWAIEADLLSLGLINIISNHSPDKIILGGGVMSQRHLLPMIRNNIGKFWNNFTPLGNISDLITSPVLGKDSGIIGSLSLVC